MTDKKFYALGCTCVPNTVLRKHFTEYSMSSIFAGTAQCQRLTSTFIPQFLFDGTLEQHFFNTENWTIYHKLKCNNDIFIDDKKTKFISLLDGMNNAHDLRAIPQDISQLACDLTTTDIKIIYNDKLFLVQHHAFDDTQNDNTKSISPFNVKYNYDKYMFWKQHKHDFNYQLLVHPFCTYEMLYDFEQEVQKLGYDLTNFTYYFTNGKAINGLIANCKYIPDFTCYSGSIIENKIKTLISEDYSI